MWPVHFETMILNPEFIQSLVCIYMSMIAISLHELLRFLLVSAASVNG